jgi:hypothetical protein
MRATVMRTRTPVSLSVMRPRHASWQCRSLANRTPPLLGEASLLPANRNDTRTGLLTKASKAL